MCLLMAVSVIGSHEGFVANLTIELIKLIRNIIVKIIKLILLKAISTLKMFASMMRIKLK